MKEQQSNFNVTMMSRVLKVSRSGYYAWLTRGPSLREKENEFLDQKILEIFKFHRKRYGPKRVWIELGIAGIICGLKRVINRFKALGLKALAKKKYKATTDSDHGHQVAENVLNRDFTTTGLDQKWVGDITYIPTVEGWLYLATVIDLHSRKVIGWAMSKRINKQLVCDAMLMALYRRGFPSGVIFHSDRGSQYCSNRFQKLLKDSKMICSMSRKGNCWDNAIAESFFKTLKVELVYQTTYATRDDARADIFEYIETYYNRIRRHSALDYLTPNEVELGIKNVA